MAEVEIPITYQAYVASQLIQGPTTCSGTPIPFRATAAHFRAYEFPNGKVVIEQQDNSDTPWRLIVEYYFSATPSPRVNRELKSFPGEASQGKIVLPEDLLP